MYFSYFLCFVLFFLPGWRQTGNVENVSQPAVKVGSLQLNEQCVLTTKPQDAPCSLL